MRSWISRFFKNALVRRLVCDGASSCHHGGKTTLAVLVDAHIGIEICLSCGSSVNRRRSDENHVTYKHEENVVELGKSTFHIEQIENTMFSSKKGLIVKRSFPFLHFLLKETFRV